MPKPRAIALLAALPLLAACVNTGLNDTEAALVGATGGALVADATGGNVAAGALAGGAAGALINN